MIVGTGVDIAEVPRVAGEIEKLAPLEELYVTVVTEEQ